MAASTYSLTSTSAIRRAFARLAHRARARVTAGRPRMKVDRSEQQRVVERFLDALTSGDVQGLMEVWAPPDVVAVADGGGLAAAARHPVVGAGKVVAFLSQFSTLAPDAVVDTLWLSGALGGRIVLNGELNTAMVTSRARRRPRARGRERRACDAAGRSAQAGRRGA